MKALTLTQPWASAVALGYKTIETRSWRTNYQGSLAIHAAKGFPAYAKEFAAEESAAGRLMEPLPFAVVICIVALIDCRAADYVGDEIGELERRYGDYSKGRWAWE